MKTTVIIKGFDKLPVDVQDAVLKHLLKIGLSVVIVPKGGLDYSDILMDVESGYHTWNERIKAYLGAVIYVLLNAFLSGIAPGSVVLDMPLPPLEPDIEMEN